ncbi:MAG TPA: 50S ribosomal protein L18 [Acidimicrobiia bacterium]|nr:50S ribosomal protein L18 [Acidimicrobiia bacterium]
MLKTSKNARTRRHIRVRRKVEGSAARPRLAVFRSNKHIVAQIIDDIAGVTIASASTNEKDFSGLGSNVEAAKKIGASVASRAKEKGIATVVFDRGGYKYHGRVAAVADAAREAGLEF